MTPWTASLAQGPQHSRELFPLGPAEGAHSGPTPTPTLIWPRSVTPTPTLRLSDFPTLRLPDSDFPTPTNFPDPGAVLSPTLRPKLNSPTLAWRSVRLSDPN
eukprot:gene11459-biopygen18396